jgi:hypothetical protein
MVVFDGAARIVESIDAMADPFRQVRCPNSLRPRLESELKSMGIEVEWEGPSLLVKDPTFRELVCRRGKQCRGIAVGPDPDSSGHFVMVYLNLLDDELMEDVANRLESLGAERGSASGRWMGRWVGLV